MPSRKPKHIADVLSDLFTRRGYGRVQGQAQYAQAWQQVAGPELAAVTRPGRLYRGTLEVIVGSSTLAHELAFQQRTLLQRMQELLPDEGIEKLRFKVGPLE